MKPFIISMNAFMPTFHRHERFHASIGRNVAWSPGSILPWTKYPQHIKSKIQTISISTINNKINVDDNTIVVTNTIDNNMY